MTLQEKFDNIINEIEKLIDSGQHHIPEMTQIVAKHSGFETRLLSDAFRFMTDMTIADYIKRRLLICALGVKLDCEVSVEDICGKAGYAEAASFSKACKNLLGCSPSQFTRDMLLKHTPLFFERLVADKEADQMGSEILTTMKDNNTICGVSAAQFAEIKQILEIGAIYGLSDEEAEFVYRLATERKLTLTKAAEFYDDFKLQIENGSNIPGLDLFEMAEVACKHNLSFSQTQSIMFELEKHGYNSISQLPDEFLDVLLSKENARFGWDVPYIIEIAEALKEHGFSASDLGTIADLASTYEVSVVEVIENYEQYESDWDDGINKLMHYDNSAEDPCGFGYRSIWELDEGQESPSDVADASEDEASFSEDTIDDAEDDSEAVFLARKYRIPLREALELMRDLESNGYYNINDLPQGFFEIYFSYDIDQFVGWDIPYVCGIAKTMAENHIPMDRLGDVMYLASKHNVDPGDVIENFDHYTNL